METSHLIVLPQLCTWGKGCNESKVHNAFRTRQTHACFIICHVPNPWNILETQGFISSAWTSFVRLKNENIYSRHGCSIGSSRIIGARGQGSQSAPRHASSLHHNSGWHRAGQWLTQDEGSGGSFILRCEGSPWPGLSPQTGSPSEGNVLGCPLDPSWMQGITNQLLQRCPWAFSSDVDCGNWCKYVQLPGHVFYIRPA